jgi:hypothetical protein
MPAHNVKTKYDHVGLPARRVICLAIMDKYSQNSAVLLYLSPEAVQFAEGCETQ